MRGGVIGILGELDRAGLNRDVKKRARPDAAGSR